MGVNEWSHCTSHGAEETVVGHTARYEDLDLDGVTEPEADIREALSAPAEQWANDIEDNAEYLTFLGPKVPQEIHDQFAALKQRVEAAVAAEKAEA